MRINMVGKVFAIQNKQGCRKVYGMNRLQKDAAASEKRDERSAVNGKKHKILLLRIILGILAAVVLIAALLYVRFRILQRLESLPYERVDEAYVPEASEWTMLVYLCGSDLESRSGYASMAIRQMLEASKTEDLQIVIETGGAADWHEENIQVQDSDLPGDGVTDRFVVQDNTLKRISAPEQSSMVSRDTLSEFIAWGIQTAPAEHYMLILWDHGMGAPTGFGKDQIFYQDEALSVADIADCIRNSGTYFDLIGFDACLMGGVETAAALKDCADYLLVSEEVEPGSGWNYQCFIDRLCSGTEPDLITACEVLIENYIADGATLALVDLKQVDLLNESLAAFMREEFDLLWTDSPDGAKKKLSPEGYYDLSRARGGAVSYGYDHFDLIDLQSYVENSMQTAQRDGRSRWKNAAAKAVLQALQKTVVINGNRQDNCCGLSFYSPYVYPDRYARAADQLQANGLWPDAVREFYDSFVSILIFGALDADTLSDAQRERYEKLTQEEWFLSDEELEVIRVYEKQEAVDLSGVLTGEEDDYYIYLTPQQYDRVTQIRTMFFYNEGDHSLHIGTDAYAEIYEEEDGYYLKLFDPGVQLYFGGQRAAFLVTYYEVGEDGSFEARGTIPARLNGSKNIEIIVLFDSEHAVNGQVLGYIDEDALDEGVSSRENTPFNEGDIIELLFDYYDADMVYYKTDVREGGTPIVYHGNGDMSSLEAAYYETPEESRTIYYELTDIFRNSYITDGIRIDFEPVEEETGPEAGSDSGSNNESNNESENGSDDEAKTGLPGNKINTFEEEQ